MKPAYTLVCGRTSMYVLKNTATFRPMRSQTKTRRLPNEVRRIKAASRDSEYRQKLIDVGTRLFVSRGMAHVTVEDVIGDAGMSRATFYGFFANKDELAASILNPVFESGVAALKELNQLAPMEAAEQLIEVYLKLWHQHKEALFFTNGANESVFSYIKKSHREFSLALKAILVVVHSGGLLRNDSVDLTYAVLAKTGIPLLRVYRGHKNLDQLYRDSLLALIVKPEAMR